MSPLRPKPQLNFMNTTRFHRYIFSLPGLRRSLAAAGCCLLLLSGACSGKKKDVLQASIRFGQWEVLRNSKMYASPDSVWFVINPAKPESDNDYLFNGVYSSPYVENDSVRAVVIFDSYKGYFAALKRNIAIEVNPSMMILDILPERLLPDTPAGRRRRIAFDQHDDKGVHPYRMTLTRVGNDEYLFRFSDQELIDSLLRAGGKLLFHASTPLDIQNSNNMQFYKFAIEADSFPAARKECLRLQAEHLPDPGQPSQELLRDLE